MVVAFVVSNNVHTPIIPASILSDNVVQLAGIVSIFGIVTTLFMSGFSLNKIGGVSNVYIGDVGILARNLVKKCIRVVNINFVIFRPSMV